MKKGYSEPEAKVVRFNVRDIVITSGEAPTPEIEIEDVDRGNQQ